MSMPATIDGACGEKAISEVFAAIYKALYNQVGYLDDEMTVLAEEIEEKCNQADRRSRMLTTAEHIQEAKGLLNRGKRDGDGVFSTDHIIHGGASLYNALSILFSPMLHYGYTPSQMLASVVIPIPKSKRKSLNDSSNYRGIALNSPLSKLLELIVLITHHGSLATTDQQFGFKAKTSTTQCTFTVLESIQYFNQRERDTRPLHAP